MKRRSGWILLALGLCAPLTVVWMPSADLWWHLALGREIVQTGQIPTVDPFSFTAAGAPWQDDQWLSGLLFYLLYQGGGLWLLEAAKTLLLLAAVAVGLVHASRRGAVGLALPVAAVGCMLFADRNAFFDLRPQLVTYLMAALFLWLIGEYAQTAQPRRYLVAFPALMVLWANLHPGFILGPGLLTLAALGLVAREETRPRAWGLLGAMVASVAAACLNLSGGWRMLVYPFRLSSTIWKQHLNEWQPLISQHGIRMESAAYLGFLVITLAMLVLLRRRFQPWELATLIPLGLFSLTGWRHVPLFCFATVAPWAMAWRLTVPARLDRLAGVLGVALLVATLLRPDFGKQVPEARYYPRWAAQFLAANQLPRNLFHPYGWGGYLEWKLGKQYRYCIDGRALTVYSDQAYLNYLKAAYNRKHTTDILDALGVRVALCFRDADWPECSARLFDRDPRWVSIYQDDIAMIYVRRLPETESLLARPFVFPASPYRLVQQAQADFSRDPYQCWKLALQARQLDDGYAPAALALGALAFAHGSPQDGVVWTRQALREDPSITGAHFNLAVYYRRQHDWKLARRELQAELANNPTCEPARHMLATLPQ
ncbi:MAG: tetratricopeptide repeat protein [Candidatus Xenobia bacterium]